MPGAAGDQFGYDAILGERHDISVHCLSEEVPVVLSLCLHQCPAPMCIREVTCELRVAKHGRVVILPSRWRHAHLTHRIRLSLMQSQNAACRSSGRLVDPKPS